jgi:U3 small nucleolar RNA-associated protein 12
MFCEGSDQQSWKVTEVRTLFSSSWILTFFPSSESLMVLPFNNVISLFGFLDEWIQQGIGMELVSRVGFFLLKLHQTQISSNPRTLQKVLLSLQSFTRNQIQSMKDVVGFNRAALGFLKRDLDMNDSSKVWI